MTLTKAELADTLFEKVGLNKREAKDMVETFFDEIRNALERGESVKLSGFGNFQLRDKPQRPGRNPKTGQLVKVDAKPEGGMELDKNFFLEFDELRSHQVRLEGGDASSDSYCYPS